MNYQKIADLVSDILGIEIRSNTRRRAYAEARAIYYHICRKHYGASFYDISNVVGKHHATIIHGIEMFNNLYGSDKLFTSKADTVRDAISKASMTSDNDSSEVDELLIENKIMKIKINELTLRAETLEREFDRINRLSSIIDRLQYQIPRGKEMEAEKQINRFLNGVRF